MAVGSPRASLSLRISAGARLDCEAYGTSDNLDALSLAIELMAMTKAYARRIDVFFYGLFMDEALLREKGIEPLRRRMARVEDFSLVIGERATLVPCAGQTAHGVIFSLTHAEVETLYSEASVHVYRPEAVSAQLATGDRLPALCFNLPAPPSSEERNPRYAAKLRELAARIGLPGAYVSSIQ
jgi:hypothetical protein